MKNKGRWFLVVAGIADLLLTLLFLVTVVLCFVLAFLGATIAEADDSVLWFLTVGWISAVLTGLMIAVAIFMIVLFAFQIWFTVGDFKLAFRDGMTAIRKTGFVIFTAVIDVLLGSPIALSGIASIVSAEPGANMSGLVPILLSGLFLLAVAALKIIAVVRIKQGAKGQDWQIQGNRQ
jgi:hypothetical protein